MSCRHGAGPVPVGAGLGRSVPVPVLVTVTVLVPAPGVGNAADRCRSVPRSLKDRKKRCISEILEISPWAYLRENTVIKLIFNLNYFKDKK
jgi:hypothetical protein